MSMKVTFPGNKKVRAEYKGFTIDTDQPVNVGGEGSAPTPFDLFLASIATCSGIFVKLFCDNRELSSEGITIEQDVEFGPQQSIQKITIDIKVPESFPAKYHDALVRAADQCLVKRTIQTSPIIEVKTVVE